MSASGRFCRKTQLRVDRFSSQIVDVTPYSPVVAGFFCLLASGQALGSCFGPVMGLTAILGGSVFSYCAMRLRFCAVAVSKESSMAPGALIVIGPVATLPPTCHRVPIA